MLAQSQKRQVHEAVKSCLVLAEKALDKQFKLPDILFDLHARAAGQYRYKAGLHQLRFNPYLFHTSFAENLAETVPHEVAHYVTFSRFGRVRPHGKEWQAVMTLFGANVAVTHNQDVSTIPLRQERRWRYRCGCQTHALSTRRHNKIRFKEASYSCRQCGQVLRMIDEP